MDRIRGLTGELERNLSNFKKSQSRGFKTDTLKSKLDRLEEVKREFRTLIDTLDESEALDSKIKFNKISRELENLLEKALQEATLKENSEMANFDLGTAMKAIPVFEGKYSELSAFLKIIEFIGKTLSDTAKTDLLDFVFNVKLSLNVQTALGTQTPTTFEDLKRELCSRYKNNNTVSQIHTTLGNLAQKRSTVSAYKDRILTLVSELNQLQIAALGTTATPAEKAAVKTINDSYALTIFKNGLSDQYRSTVFASRPKNFQEAIEITLELEKSEQQPVNNSIMHFRRQSDQNKYSNGRYNNNNRSYNNDNNRQSARGYNNQNNNYRSNNNYRNNNNNYRNNNNNTRSNYNNQNNSRNFNQNNSRGPNEN